jgi:ketosteroid isomerase-like protein
MTANLNCFKTIDDAYNSRDWETYSGLLDEEFRGWVPGSAAPEGKLAHIRAAQEFCSAFPDNRVHNAPYIVALADGEWTCTIARFTGTMWGSFQSSGKVLQPTNLPFDTSFATLARWADQRIVEEHAFLDTAGILRQVGNTK